MYLFKNDLIILVIKKIIVKAQGGKLTFPNPKVYCNSELVTKIPEQESMIWESDSEICQGNGVVLQQGALMLVRMQLTGKSLGTGAVEGPGGLVSL